MSTQIRNDDLINLLRGDVQMRYEQAFHWSQAISTYLNLPGLRGFWPMSSVAYTNPQALDESGNVNHLTNNNVSTFGYTNLIPHVSFVLASSKSLFKADGGAANWADVSGTESYIDAAARGLTLYAWVNFDNAAAVGEYIISKWGASGNLSYRLLRLAAGTLRGSVSVDGTAVTSATSTGTLTQSTWYFTALQYDPSTKLSVWLGSSSGLEEGPNAVGIPASIFDSTAAFVLGAQTVASNFMDGKQSMVALCAAFHSDSIIKAVFNQTRALFNV